MQSYSQNVLNSIIQKGVAKNWYFIDYNKRNYYRGNKARSVLSFKVFEESNSLLKLKMPSVILHWENTITPAGFLLVGFTLFSKLQRKKKYGYAKKSSILFEMIMYKNCVKIWK